MQIHPHQQSTQSAASSPRPRSFSVVCQSLTRLSCAVALALSIAFTSVSAQEAATGTVRGKVQNASNGKFVENASISVAGTNLQVVSNAFGEYQLSGVPSGQVTLTARYTGEPDQSLSVAVAPGAVVNQDITFRETAETQRRADGTIVLDPFVVSAERYRNAQAIAVAETRTSVNIKNVISTDAFGDIPSGNVGEFLKFVPGIQVDYGSFNGNNQGYADSDATGVSIRGFGPEDTAILIDGLPVASATPGNLSRQVALDQLSINNASRIEVTKVSTPDMSSNSVGGQVNLITKSAFEQAKPSYSGRIFFNINSLQPSLNKTPGPTNKATYKTQPGIEFSAAYPFSKNLGVSLTASATNQINQTNQAAPTWNTATTSYANLAGKVVSLENPVLSRSQVTDTMQLAERVSANMRVDWKPSPAQLLRANVQYSTFSAVEGQRRLDFRPTLAAGADWGADYTVGTTANSTIAQTVTTRDREGDTKTAQLQYSLDKGGWKINAAASVSQSSSEFKDIANGHFSESAYNLNPGQVILRGITNGAPGEVSSVWRTNAGTGIAGTPKNHAILSNWSFDGTTAKSGQALNTTTDSRYKIDVERDLSFLPFLGSNSLSFKFGAQRDIKKTEKSGLGTGYAEILRPGASYVLSDVLDTDYIGQSPGFGLPGQEWGSNYKLFVIEQERDIFYAPDGPDATNNQVNNYNSFANQQKSISDTADGFYAMLSGKFFRNRLFVVAGARQEISEREGYGPRTDNQWFLAKNPDGTLYRDDLFRNGVPLNGSTAIRTNADGTTTSLSNFNFLGDSALLSRLTAAGVKYPSALYASSATDVNSRKLQLLANQYIKARVTGDPSFSFNTAYKLTKKIDLKAAVSRSLKQPSLENAANGLLSGNGAFVITENTTIPADGTLGTIAVANPNLLPEISLNYDFQVSYYTDSGGSLSVSYYQKHITNQVENNSSYSNDPIFAEVVSALGLDPASYENFRLNTSYNGQGTQKTDGWEFEVRQDFGFLGAYGKRFSAFASYAFNSLGDPAAPVPYTITTPTGSVVTLTPTVQTITRRANKFGGAGLQYSGRKLSVQLRGTYRNENEVSRTTLTGVYAGNFLRRYQPEATTVDVNVNYVLSKRYSLFLSGRDVLNGDREEIFKDDMGLYPTYAATASYRKFGTTWSFGINGKF